MSRYFRSIEMSEIASNSIFNARVNVEEPVSPQFLYGETTQAIVLQNFLADSKVRSMEPSLSFHNTEKAHMNTTEMQDKIHNALRPAYRTKGSWLRICQERVQAFLCIKRL